ETRCRERGSVCLAARDSQVGAEPADVESGLGLAQRVEVDEATGGSVEDDLARREVAVAKARRPSLERRAEGAELGDPAGELPSELGREAPERRHRLTERSQFVVE